MRSPRRIIVPVTLGEECAEAVPAAAEIAAAVGAELLLAGIAPVAVRTQALDAPDVMLPLRPMEEQELLERLVMERAAELADALGPTVKTRTLLTSGPVGVALVDAAREEEADLIVVPIRRGNELSHLLHDHLDRYVLHHSDVPVLVVPVTIG